MTRDRTVPGWGQRLRYTLGGRLPGYREWVRHDLTDSGWRARAYGRLLVQVLPLVVVLAVLPGPAYLHWMLPLFLLICSSFMAVGFAEELRDRRLRAHGLPVPRTDAAGPAGR